MYPYLEVNTSALARNAAAVKAYVGVPVIGVVKSDGYGVSVMAAAKAWMACGVTMLAVSRPEEALALRRGGFGGDILMLCPAADVQTLHLLTNAQVILPVTSWEIARFYSQNSRVPVRVHVAVDTGMGRFGIHWADAFQLRQVYETDNLSFLGIYSHFAASFEKRFCKTRKQLDRFLDTCKRLEKEGYPIGMRHIANSCAALRFPQTRLDAVRIGSALVGQVCAPVPLKLETVAVCKACVVDHRLFMPGDTTGYASLCSIKKQTNAIIVAVGHECGVGLLKTPNHYPFRALAGYLVRIWRQRNSPPYILYEGRRLKLIGRLGNQFSLFDAEELDIPLGSRVELKANLLHPWSRREFV